jgi:MoxR-like ATPase
MTQTQLGDETQKIAVRLAQNDAESELYILHGDTQEKLITLVADPISRQISATINHDSALIDITNAKLAGKVSTIPQGGAPTGITRNWRIDEAADGAREFVVWFDKHEVRLPIASEPGRYTPKGVPEVYGQDEMLYVLAVGIKTGGHTLLSGPTGTAKTTVWAWLAEKLNYNLVVMPMSGSTEAAHLIGEYLPAPAADNSFGVAWTDGPAVAAVRMSQSHPTILMFDEFNRIRNIAEVARIYPLLDNQRFIELVEKRNGGNSVERLDAGELYIGATMNPADDEAADYSGVLELDPALMSRFANVPEITYPPIDIEIRAIMARVPTLTSAQAKKMVDAARRIRAAVEVRFPVSFRELEAWGKMMEFMDYDRAAEVTVVRKAHADARPSVRNLLKLQG